MRFVKAQLPGSSPIPRDASGMPLDMAERAWGVDRYTPMPVLPAPLQTGQFTHRPFIAFGRSYPGLQLKNGVAQLDTNYEVPSVPGITSPYWQQTIRTNPPTFLRGAGSPYPPQGPYQIAQMFGTAGQSNIADIGPAYLIPA